MSKINLNVDIDLGNLWEMLSALGTLAAVILSLFLALKKENPKINIVLTVDNFFKKGYQLALTKNPLDVLVIMEIGYYHCFRKCSYNGNVFILNKEGFEVSEGMPIDFSSLSVIRLMIDKKCFALLFNKKVRFYVKDIEGRTYKSNKVLVKELK